MSARKPVVGPLRSARVVAAIREIRTAPRRKQAAFVANGRAIPIVNRNAPIGGPTSWFVSSIEPWIRAFPSPRSSRLTRLGRSVLLAESAKTSAVASAKRAIRTIAMLTDPVTTVYTRTDSIAARLTLAMTTIRLRSTRSATAPPGMPKRRNGRYSLRTARETRKGSRVSDATSSGPAATVTPSPRLLTNDAEKSQRKLRPSRAGAIASEVRAGRRRTGRRITPGLAAGAAHQRVESSDLRDRDHDLSRGPAFVDLRQRLDDALQRISPVDERADLARGDQRLQRVNVVVGKRLPAEHQAHPPA